jgi:3-dehydroquinate synthase
VTGDVAGFAASTYMRGIRVYSNSNDLLAMVDSSVGGKTGVNFNNQKNIIGTFYQPDLFLYIQNFLSTLYLKGNYISGAGEIFKYSFLADAKNYNLLKNNLLKLFTFSIKLLQQNNFACLEN